nr:hypothetical protein [Tanacetum cinerariifolium]
MFDVMREYSSSIINACDGMTLSAHSSSIMNLIVYDSNAAISSISNVSPSLLLGTIFFDDEEVEIVIGILEWQLCKNRTFALGDKPQSFFAPEGKPPRRVLNPRPLACATLVLPSDSITDQIYISGPQAFYGVRLPNNNRNNNNDYHGNHNNSRGNNNNRCHDTGANSHVKPNLETMDNSEACHDDNALHVGNGNNKYTIDNIICQHGSAFALKYLGRLNYFLGIKIYSHVSGILLSGKKSILELLQSAGLSNCNLVSCPMVTSSSLSLDDSTAFSNPIKYQKVVGSLQYVTLSRPNIAFAVNKKGNSDTSLEAFSDADWLEIQMIDEAEYKDLADIVVELTWLQALLNELGIYSSSTPIIWCDNLGNNKGTIDNIYCQLGFAFALKNLGPLNYFLGIEIVSHVFGILLSQKKSILELLQSDGLSNCNLLSSLMLTSSSLSLDDSTAFFNPVKYRQVVGSLQYVTLSRPDMAFAVNKVCQYMHALTENHWSVVKRILRYLHGTVEHGMLIRCSSGSTLQAFTNVLWKGNSDTFLKAFSDADWLEIQMIDEAEYKDLADTVVELTWLQALLNELRICSSSTPILWCDNLGATYLLANPIFH